MSFSQEIIRWYQVHKRPLPWRTSTDPYKIWLSEIILQQTKVSQGTPYYMRFVSQFPTVFDLANASEEDVLKMWQGLGYYSRARNLHSAAKQVVNDFEGIFPKDYKGLLSLKGVGDYTASAIASICYHQPEAVLDGNVYRVLARYFGMDTPINTTQGFKLFKWRAQEHCDLDKPSDYNQGLMEFGALQCVPKSPDCSSCPLQQSCIAYQTNQVEKLPVKVPKKKPLKVFHHYVVYLDPNGHTIYTKREGKGIWEGLYEFPLLEASHPMEKKDVEEAISTMDLPKPDPLSLSLFNTEAVLHKLTHRHIYAYFWVARTTHSIEPAIAFKHINTYPTSVLISDFIRAFKNSYF